MGNGGGEKGEINFATVPSSVAVSLSSVCMTQNLPGKVSTSLRIKEHRRILEILVVFQGCPQSICASRYKYMITKRNIKKISLKEFGALGGQRVV